MLLTVGLNNDAAINSYASIARLEAECVAARPSGSVLGVIGRERPVFEPRIL